VCKQIIILQHVSALYGHHQVKYLQSLSALLLFISTYFSFCDYCFQADEEGEAKGSAYRMLMGKPEGKKPLGRPRRRCLYNIKMDLRGIGWDGRDWIGTSGGLL
jgi:hypothetical protein